MAAVAVRSLLASDHLSLRSPNTMGSIDETEVDWHLPRHSWDTHVHVFDPANYPYSPSRSYSPETATYDSLLAFNSNLIVTHIPQNFVFVQPSPYGTDNSLILDHLRKHASCEKGRKKKHRAIVVIDENEITDDQLQEWDDIGVRGFRINTESSANGIDYDHLKQKIVDVTNRVSKFNHWKCQLFVSGDSWDHLREVIEGLPLKVIADHQGGMKGTSALTANVSLVTEQPGYASLISLAKTGKVFVKVSGFYRSSKLTTGGYDDLEPLIKAFVEEIPEQLIWASDWPHTGSAVNRTEENKYIPETFRDINNTAVLQNIRNWATPDVWEDMMVKTPEKVYC